LGAASRPIEAPIPMTTSEITEVPRQRRNDSRPSPFHTASSISDGSPLVYRRSKNHAPPPNAPAISSEATRRAAGACSVPYCRLPSW
jgi:hypothetical protein